MDSNFIGSRIDGKFLVLSLLGKGGLGAVYKAEQTQLSRFVAIKFLHDSQTITPANQARFEREAKILAGFDHKHIVDVYSVGILNGNEPYLVMEYLQGRTLASLLQTNAPLDWSAALRIIMQICQALEYAHKQGIIHRDLKPQNIMLLDEPESNFVKILDFGLSRLMFSSQELPQKITQTGALIGSAHYMAPEICSGQKADARSDIYSLGCIFYECLCGHVPLDAEHPIGLLHKHVSEIPKPLPASIPEGIQLIVFKAMQKDQSKRFQSMAEFEEALKLVQVGREAEIGISGIKLGELKKSRQTEITIKALILITVMVLLCAGTTAYMTSKMKEQLHLSARARMANPAVRREQIRRAQGFALDAENFLRAGQAALAEQSARRALLTIAQPYSQAAFSKDFAASDLSILKSAGNVLTKSKQHYPIVFSQMESTIRANDEAYFDYNQRADLNLTMAEISTALGNFYDSMNDIYAAAKFYALSKQFSKCQKLIASKEKMPVLDKDQKISRDTCLKLSKIALLLEQGEKEKAHKLASELRPELAANTYDSFQKYVWLYDLANFQINCGNLEAALDCLKEAKSTAFMVRASHPEAYAEAAYRLSILYQQLQEYDKARAELKELRDYLNQANDTGLKKRFLKEAEVQESALDSAQVAAHREKQNKP